VIDAFRRSSDLGVLVRLGWLVAIDAAILAHGGDLAAVVPLLAIASAGWIGWTATYGTRRPRRAAVSIAALGCSGAALAVLAPLGVAFVAAAAVCAASSFEVRRAWALGLVGPVVLAAASWKHGWSQGLVLGGTAAALAGLVLGVARRQSAEAAVDEARTDLARELHDVLAHTLSALAVQLEAADAVLESGDEAKLRELLRRSRRLVASGIDEATSAVRALRNEPVAIAERLADLVAAEQIPLRVEGTPRPLPPGAGLALYRVAQEALTNARKHAPGAPTSVSLAFRDRATVVTVRNGPGEAALPGVGSGLGLQGMRERLELAGGALTTAATPDGWTVEATVQA
jgi:signal transduction histidine kinase